MVEPVILGSRIGDRGSRSGGSRIADRGSRVFWLVVLLACSKAASNVPAVNQPVRMPDLTGQSVLLLPVQPGAVPSATVTVPGSVRLDGVSRLDAELAYWLMDRASAVRWVLPEAIERTLSRSPAIDIKPRALEVSAFRRTQVKRIGDPLFGDLHRLSSIFDARLALVPVAAEFKLTGAEHGRIEIALALIETGFGQVIWFGVLSGDDGAATDAALAASAAQRVANAIAPRKED